MNRDSFLSVPVDHMKLKAGMSVNELILEFRKSSSFGAGRLSTACDIFERMVRDDGCSVFLALAGAMVPAGLRRIISDLLRRKLIDVIVSTGANIVHDLLEALGGRHYKGHWLVDDRVLCKYHIYRIYDVFVPEEDFVNLDIQLTNIFGEIAEEKGEHSLSSSELMWEIGKHVNDEDSILKVAYETKTPIFIPAIRDSEFSVAYWYHALQKSRKLLSVDAFKEVTQITEIMEKSPRIGMVVIGGGVPRNTVQHTATMVRKGISYAVVITMDRQETGGLSGSTIEESISWGKVKMQADKVMVVGDATLAFPLMTAAVLERLGPSFAREKPACTIEGMCR